MAIIKDVELIENKDLRAGLIEKVEVLDKVKSLILLPNTELMTTKMVADYFEVPYETVATVVKRNVGELTSNGMKLMNHSEIKKLVGDDIKMYGISKRGSYVLNLKSLIALSFMLSKSAIAYKVREEVVKNEYLVKEYNHLIIKKSNSLLKENEAYEVLKNSFNGLCEIKRSVYFDVYYIDFVLSFGNVDIAVEIDEFGHSNYHTYNELKREKDIKSKYILLRYNPDSDESITSLINSILVVVMTQKCA